jgi:Flp pilus assembly protein TadD
MSTAERIVASEMTAETCMKRAASSAEDGDYVGAAQHYTQAIQLDPTHARAYGNRGLMRANLGDRRGAREDWQMAAKLFLAQGSTANYEMVLNYSNKVEMP